MKTDTQILADAILDLARQAGKVWDYDGEQMISEGITLENEREISRISDGKKNERS